jgi:phosphatidylserine/phosphatidylglycerophosphate/cardiolipin synthase-like enzyme
MQRKQGSTDPRAIGTLLIAGIVVLLAVLVIVGAYFYLTQRGPTTSPEQTASERARAPETPRADVTPAILGGGGSPVAATWYELYFTTPVYPDRPETRRGGIDEKLVAFINTAKVSIDAADYDFDLENVANALAAAKKRGVRVRFVTDTDTLTNKDAAVQKAWSILRAAEIPIVDDQRGPIMHNKFMVVDGEWVWTGSWNWTIGDTYRLNNNAIKIRSPELAANYAAEFEKMFTQRKFGPTKPKGVPNPNLTIGGAPVENYFAAEDGVAAHVIERLQGAQKSIQFLAFSFTHDGIGSAVIERAKAGVQVRGVFETTGSQTQFSELGPMKQAALEVYTDGNPYVMHHKVFVIDGRTVIFGSFNFSSNADKDNDENLLIVDDEKLAAAFLAEVERVVQTAKTPPDRKR